MSSCIAIIAALPREIGSLVKGYAPDSALRTRGIFLYRLPNAIVVAAGMGAARAALAVEAALSASPDLATLISTGLAGSCSSSLAAGSVAEANIIIDTHTGERFHSSAPTSPQTVTLATTESIASIHEKARLQQTYSAAMVDMEAATVGRLARAHNLGFRAIKGISDAFDFELASLSQFAGKHGSFRTGAFALHTALRPWTWSRAIELGSGSSQALSALTLALQHAIAAQDTAAPAPLS